MGLPAVRRELPSLHVRPHLALADGARVRRMGPERRATSATCRSAKCRDAFNMFLVLAILFSALGVARVALASRAAAVSIESGRMRTRIKEARFRGDMLEIKLSQLATPSRIRVIADKKMQMAPAAGISYLTIDGAPPTASRSASARAPSRDGASSSTRGKAGVGLLSSIMHTAAGEAQVLLLGDVGLSSSR